MRMSALWALGPALVVLNAGAARAQVISYYSMNETSGDLADSAGGVTMTPQDAAAFTYGAPSVPAGTYGAITLTPAQAAAFRTAITGNGASTFRNMTSGNPLNSLAAPLTVMAWINPTALVGIQRVISGSGGDGNGWGYGILGSGNQRYTTYGVTDYDQQAGATVQPGAWQHVAVTFTGTSADIYLNGNLVNTRTGGNFAANTNEVFALFGQGNAGATERFTGTIDEVRVYGGILTQAQIVAAASAPVAVPEPSSLGLLGLCALGLLTRRRRTA
jgi:Concanavalin A-like lectin/glucanases superfamily/PEP-CTERM motif